MMTDIRSKIKNGVTSLLVCGAALLLLTYSEKAADGVSKGLQLSADTLIPALFPFLAVTSFLSESGAADRLSEAAEPLNRRVLHLPQNTAGCFLISLVGGYPSGASAVNHLYETGKIPRKDAEDLLCVCCFAGPAFIISAVGQKLFGSIRAGWLLFLCHIAAGFLLLRFIRFSKGKGTAADAVPSSPLSECFVRSVSRAVISMLSICGFTLVFSVLFALCEKIIGGKISSALLLSLLRGSIEVTNGLLSACPLLSEIRLPLAAFLLSFGGLSVLCQICSAAGSIRPKISRLIGYRLLGGILSALLTAGILFLFPKEYFSGEAFSVSAGTPALSHSTPISLFPLFFLTVSAFLFGDMGWNRQKEN